MQTLRLTLARSVEDFVGVHDSIRVKDALDLPHDPDHIICFRVIQVLGLLETNSVFSTNATFVVTDERHDEWIDKVVETLLEVEVVVARNAAVQVQVAVTHVAVPNCNHRVLLFLAQSR